MVYRLRRVSPFATPGTVLEAELVESPQESAFRLGPPGSSENVGKFARAAYRKGKPKGVFDTDGFRRCD